MALKQKAISHTVDLLKQYESYKVYSIAYQAIRKLDIADNPDIKQMFADIQDQIAIDGNLVKESINWLEEILKDETQKQ